MNVRVISFDGDPTTNNDPLPFRAIDDPKSSPFSPYISLELTSMGSASFIRYTIVDPVACCKLMPLPGIPTPNLEPSEEKATEEPNLSFALKPFKVSPN